MKIYDMEQGSEEWYMVRRGKPTASQFGRIITAAKGDYSKSAKTYMYELIGEIAMGGAPVGVESYTSKQMQDGIDCEPEARRWYEFNFDCEVRQVGFVFDGRFGCSPDGLVGDVGMLELKCPMLKTQAKYLAEGVLPPEYKQQVHGSLIVTGREWCDFVSYAPGLPEFRVRVEPDEYTEAMREALNKFWDEWSELIARDVFAELFEEAEPIEAMI